MNQAQRVVAKEMDIALISIYEQIDAALQLKIGSRDIEINTSVGYHRVNLSEGTVDVFGVYVDDWTLPFLKAHYVPTNGWTNVEIVHEDARPTVIVLSYDHEFVNDKIN